ncbi:serine/threonine protein kinase, partial [Myxococcota bacterium]|nr:serine/threonine protein kinase [Myxococcota bacterium]
MTQPLWSPGRLIAARYRVVSVLGAGGMGVVLHVKDERAFDQEVALKLIKASALNADALARFKREAQLAARVKSSHVVGLREFGEAEGGHPFIVMDLLQGESLDARLKRVGALPLHEAVRLLDELLSGLQDLHAQGVLHRDIKPDNVFLESSHSVRDRARLIDLGIAKTVGEQEEGHDVTRTGLVIGNPRWMSPETLRGASPSVSADLYGAALVFIRMLGDGPPHEPPMGSQASAMEQASFIHRRANETPNINTMMALRTQPPSLIYVIKAALSVDPAARFSDALTFRKHLRGALPQIALPPLPGVNLADLPAPLTQLVSPDPRQARGLNPAALYSIIAALSLGLAVMGFLLVRMPHEAPTHADQGAPVAISLGQHDALVKAALGRDAEVEAVTLKDAQIQQDAAPALRRQPSPKRRRAPIKRAPSPPPEAPSPPPPPPA